MKKCILAATLISLLSGGSLFGQGVEPQRLTQETMKFDRGPREMRLVWWIPTEFWEESFRNDPSLGEQERKAFYDAVDDYVVVAVVEAKVTVLASLVPTPKEAIAKRLSLKIGQEASLTPLDDSEIGNDAKNVFGVMKPLIKNMLGQFGEGMEFFCFNGVDAEGNRKLDPRREDFFSVTLGESTYQWRLPLGSLLPPKYDRQTGEEFPGNYLYNPFTGQKLTSEPSVPTKPEGDRRRPAN